MYLQWGNFDHRVFADVLLKRRKNLCVGLGILVIDLECIWMVEMMVVGATLVQNCGDSDIGKVVVQVAKERNLQAISIIEDKPGSPDIIEELQSTWWGYSCP